MKKIKLTIKGMHCTSCAMNIDFELEDLEGIKLAKTNYAKQESEVEYDETKVELAAIIDVVKKTGYTAIPVKSIS